MRNLDFKSSIPNDRKIWIEIKGVCYAEKIFENDRKFIEFVE